jgi:HSP20 family protein
LRRRVTSGWELELIQRHLDELLNLLAVPRDVAQTGFSPPVDLEENGEGFVVRVDLPGVAAAELVITLRERELRIVGRKPPGSDQPAKGHCHHMERGFGTFEVEVLLPGPVRPDAARATMRAGVLEVALPRIQERRDSVYTIAIRDEEP